MLTMIAKSIAGNKSLRDLAIGDWVLMATLKQIRSLNQFAELTSFTTDHHSIRSFPMKVRYSGYPTSPLNCQWLPVVERPTNSDVSLVGYGDHHKSWQAQEDVWGRVDQVGEWVAVPAIKSFSGLINPLSGFWVASLMLQANHFSPSDYVLMCAM